MDEPSAKISLLKEDMVMKTTGTRMGSMAAKVETGFSSLMRSCSTSSDSTSSLPTVYSSFGGT